LTGNQHDSEASFVSHHPTVSFGLLGAILLAIYLKFW